MTTELWVEKYRPRQLKDIVGQAANLAIVKQWMDDFQSRSLGLKRALLFSGPPGLGKTTLAHCLLSEYGYRVQEYNASDIRSQKLVEANLHDLIKTDDVDKIFGQPVKPVGIIMDEVDGMMSGDRGGLATLVKAINPFKGQRTRQALEKAETVWGPPIICICNNLDQKIQALRKECLEIKFHRPQNRDLTNLLQRVTKAEGLVLTDSARKLILEQIAQGDFRRLIFFLQYLHQLYGVGSKIDQTQVEQSQSIFAQKEQDLNMIESINQLLNQKLPAPTVMRVYNNDKSLLPLMIHENGPQSLNLQQGQAYEKLLRLQKTHRAITTGDLIDKAMYNYQCWYLQPVHGIFSCLIPTYYINQVRKSSYSRSQFTTALSRYSIACTNHKTINQIKTLVSHRWAFSTEQVHHFSRLVSQLLWHDQIDEAVRLIRYYGLKVTSKDSDLDRLIRVDRFRDKREIPVRIKNQLLNREKDLAAVDSKKSKLIFLKESKYHQARQVESQLKQLAEKSRAKTKTKPKITATSYRTKDGISYRVRPKKSDNSETKPKIKLAKPVIKIKRI